MSELNQVSSEEITLQKRGFKLLEKLNEGAYAKVFLAEFQSDSISDKKDILACKVIDTLNAPEDVIQKFLPRELDILVKLNHPHVVRVHSIFQRQSKYFIFMRYAENGDLLEYILKNGVVEEGQARIWMRQLSLGIQYLHEMEIAHRDVKCENVLLTSNYNIKLADFGFARYVVDNRGKKVLSDTYCGSLSYAAPEILRGSPYNPKAADIWALGIILYIMFNKATPFADVNLKRLYQLQINRCWKFRKKSSAHISSEAKNVVNNLLEPDVSKRWRIDQIINSDWFGMDPQSMFLTTAERAALNSAINEKRKNLEKNLILESNPESEDNSRKFETEDKKYDVSDDRESDNQISIIKNPGKIDDTSETDVMFTVVTNDSGLV